MSGQSDDWQIADDRICRRTNLDRCPIAIEFGHLHIHQDDIKKLTGEQSQNFPSVVCDGDLVSLFVEQMHGAGLVDSVVFSQKHFQSFRLAWSAIQVRFADRPCRLDRFFRHLADHTDQLFFTGWLQHTGQLQVLTSLK